MVITPKGTRCSKHLPGWAAFRSGSKCCCAAGNTSAPQQFWSPAGPTPLAPLWSRSLWGWGLRGLSQKQQERALSAASGLLWNVFMVIGVPSTPQIVCLQVGGPLSFKLPNESQSVIQYEIKYWITQQKHNALTLGLKQAQNDHRKIRGFSWWGSAVGVDRPPSTPGLYSLFYNILYAQPFGCNQQQGPPLPAASLPLVWNEFFSPYKASFVSVEVFPILAKVCLSKDRSHVQQQVFASYK